MTYRVPQSSKLGSKVLYMQTWITWKWRQFTCTLQMSLFQRSAWHTVTCMALLTFILNKASLLNFDSLFFSCFFIARNSMFSKRLTHLDWQKQWYHLDCWKQCKTKFPAHHQPIPAPASPLPFKPGHSMLCPPQVLFPAHTWLQPGETHLRPCLHTLGSEKLPPAGSTFYCALAMN